MQLATGLDTCILGASCKIVWIHKDKHNTFLYRPKLLLFFLLLFLCIDNRGDTKGFGAAGAEESDGSHACEVCREGCSCPVHSVSEYVCVYMCVSAKQHNYSSIVCFITAGSHTVHNL